MNVVCCLLFVVGVFLNTALSLLLQLVVGQP